MEIVYAFLIGHFPKTSHSKQISEAFMFVLACTYAKKEHSFLLFCHSLSWKHLCDVLLCVEMHK